MLTLGSAPSPLAAELRDGLARRQREVPSKLLRHGGGGEVMALEARVRELPEQRRVAGVERGLIAGMAPALRGAAPRAVVVVAAGESGAERALADALGAVQVVEPAGDPTTELRLPRTLATPRLYALLGNALGAHATVGAVRLLRAVRAAMGARDRLLLGLDLRRDRGQLEGAYNDVGGAMAAYHERVLGVLNRELGADFDPSRFHFRAAYDEENRRVEMHLVASGAVQATVPGLGLLAFRKGESVRTALHCVYDRGRLAAMLDGVGLRIAEWASDEGGTFALALAACA